MIFLNFLSWIKIKNIPATINENHARELLELHTVSPKAGYTQEDVIQLSYIMTGWRQRWSKSKLETGNVWFNSEYHQPGKKNVLGKEYKKGKKSLAVVIKDLVNHPNCRDFVADRLCKYLITDEKLSIFHNYYHHHVFDNGLDSLVPFFRESKNAILAFLTDRTFYFVFFDL